MNNRQNISKFSFAIVVMCFVLSTFVSLWSLRLMAEQNLRELSKSLAARIYDAIASELSEPIMVSQTMANDFFLIQALSNEKETDAKLMENHMAQYLSRIKDSLNFEAAFVVSEGSRKYFSYQGFNKFMELERSERDQWYNHFIFTGNAYDLDVDRDETAQDAWTVFVDARIEDEKGKLLGACGVGARMTSTQNLFLSLEQEYNVEINLVNPEGIIQVTTVAENLGKPFEENFSRQISNDYEYVRLGSQSVLLSRYVDKLNWFLVVQSGTRDLLSQYIHVIVLNVFLCLMVLVILLLAMGIIASRSRALAKASFMDPGTGILNRRAFEEEKARLHQNMLPESLVYLTADLNGLKTANDTLGHAAGDEMIYGAAQCLKQVLGRYGEVYRIGGDEFAAILRLEDRLLPELMQRLQATGEAWEGKLVKGISMACGYASSREFPSENLSELGRISDERMYAAKEEYYKRTGKERRKS